MAVAGLPSAWTHQTYSKQSYEEIEEESRENAEKDATRNCKSLQARDCQLRSVSTWNYDIVH